MTRQELREVAHLLALAEDLAVCSQQLGSINRAIAPYDEVEELMSARRSLSGQLPMYSTTIVKVIKELRQRSAARRARKAKGKA